MVNHVLLFSCSVSVFCFSFSRFVIFWWPQGLGYLVLCEQRISLFLWPQGIGLLVLCEQHICLPHPCFPLGQAQCEGSLHRSQGLW